MSCTEVPEVGCDLVFQGGITSGMVYPSAIVELARTHRFHNIGGASAGAIAANGAAAAEYGRQTDRNCDSLKALEDAVDELTKEDALLDLFQPVRPARRLFALALELVSGQCHA